VQFTRIISPDSVACNAGKSSAAASAAAPPLSIACGEDPRGDSVRQKGGQCKTEGWTVWRGSKGGQCKTEASECMDLG
jgi:hypothetical protein